MSKTEIELRLQGGADTAGLMKFASERGAALLVVLWVGAFFGIVLTSFAFSVRTELIAAKHFKEIAEASALAKAGIAKAIAEMINAGTRADASFRSAGRYESGIVRLGRGAYDVTVTEEDSRISLNGATPLMLRRLLRNNGVTDASLLATLADSIIDWRDPDDLHHVNGAEAEYYAALPFPYRPRNGPFEIVEELLLVRGMTPDILYGNIRDPERSAELRNRNPSERLFGEGEYLGIFSLLTVHGSGNVNQRLASLDVLVAAGLPDAEARAIIARRDNGSSAYPPGASPPIFTGHAYRIESTGRISASPASYRITASVIKEGGRQQPRFKVIAWREGLD